jgi:hypothetical protein
MAMERFNLFQKGIIRVGSDIADRIIFRNTKSDLKNRYDVTTSCDETDCKCVTDNFARLLCCESEGRLLHYRISLSDEDIMRFLDENTGLDMLTFLVFVMTHELVHMHRFSRGDAVFDNVSHEEEIVVDNMTRLFLAKNPVTGREKVYRLLDKLTPPPLYNHRTIIETGGNFDAYL